MSKQIAYIGTSDPTDANEVTVFGRTFVKGEWHDADDVSKKLLDNPTFEARDKRSRQKAEEPASE